MTTEERRLALAAMRKQYHRTCPVCGDAHPRGLCVGFAVSCDGAVEAEVTLPSDAEGYAGHIHGGTIAALLDGAMTNCLFSHGICAVTGELQVRMLQPLQANRAMVLRGWIKRSVSPLYVMEADLRQGGCVAARGKAKFMKKRPTECTPKRAIVGAPRRRRGRSSAVETSG